ncbi:4-amino-4-deoxychorismate lyase [Alkalibaculum sp. M08DMB]|uniref:4-amino-4-deoxychorismate lyase n=1 Tax=Alkalibaculum sporogenes TaxID=2655001 RepID=A0A6A7K6Q8_9FIRM|nr:aminotransferase class IV [Alkalibaculum sporogenes]MPW25084.1 4-amino-4-deoxychorismate lyase [Alkalibaculum sporogenes]
MKYISCNGILTDNQLIPLDQGYLYGYGLFETLKVKYNKILFFNEHMDRISKSSEKIGIKFHLEYSQVYTYCEELILANKINDGVLRITCSKGDQENNVIITSRENPYGEEMILKGLSIMTSSAIRNELSILVDIKTNNYLENLLILNIAKENGYNEAILYNTKGFLSEGTMSNIFFVKDSVIFTPALNNGLLSGIIRDKVIRLVKLLKLPIEEGYFTNEDLTCADEIFITNSLMEIMPVNLLDYKEFQIQNYTLTKYIMEHYRNYNY